MVISLDELSREVEISRIKIISTLYEPSLPGNVPEKHREKFLCIQQLGWQKFHEYCSQPSMNTMSGPWQRERKATAQRIFERAIKCREENRNEESWRDSIEHLIFERLYIEVTCKECSKRLWRSEIETDPGWVHDLLSLNQRQVNRKACECNPINRRFESGDEGLREIFTSWISEAVVHKRAALNTAKPIELKPDRVVGLGATSKLKQLLQRSYAHGNPENSQHPILKDLLKTSIFRKNGGDVLHFPFLVLEAKAEKGSDGFKSIEIKMALPIMHALNCQYELMKVSGNTVEVPGGPLVWFFANRGELWRAYAAYIIENEEEEPTYWIRYLWEGSVTGRNQALQLILILDAIVDWARDAYRPNIWLQLYMLSEASPANAAGFLLEEDIYSVRSFAREINNWNYAHSTFNAENEQDDGSSYWNQIPNEVEIDSNRHLDRFETAYGVIRDATHIESDLMGLMISKSNFDTLEKSFNSTMEAREFAKDILDILGKRSLLLPNSQALDKIVDLWSGSLPGAWLDEMENEEKVYAQLSVSYFIDHDWRQVRQLNFLAVSEDALPLILTCAGLRRLPGNLGHESISHPKEVEEALIDAVQHTVNNRTVRQDLIAALRRQTFYFLEVGMETIIRDDNEYTRSGLARTVGKRLDLDETSPGYLMQKRVHSTHERFRIGHLHHSASFLVRSSRLDVNTRLLWKGYVKGDRLSAKMSQRSRVPVFSRAPQVRPHQLPLEQELCIYIMDNTATEQAMISIVAYLNSFSRDSFISGTFRRDRVRLSTTHERDNIETYAFILMNIASTFNVGIDHLLRTVDKWAEELLGRS